MNENKPKFFGGFKIKPWNDPERLARRQKLMSWFLIGLGIIACGIVVGLCIAWKFKLLGI